MSAATVEKPATPEQDAGDRYAKDTDKHVMRVLRDDGLYRHLLFKAPGSSMYWFELVTWPGTLTINGDMGTWTFRREDDMFGFFRSNPDRLRHRINPSYWAEKLCGGRSGGERLAREFDERVFSESVREYAANWGESYLTPAQRVSFMAAVKREVLDPLRGTFHAEEAFDYVHDFTFTYHRDDGSPLARRLGAHDRQTFRFQDTYDLTSEGYIFQFLWCCHAVVNGIAAYDRLRATTPAPADAAAALRVEARKLIGEYGTPVPGTPLADLIGQLRQRGIA